MTKSNALLMPSFIVIAAAAAPPLLAQGPGMARDAAQLDACQAALIERRQDAAGATMPDQAPARRRALLGLVKGLAGNPPRRIEAAAPARPAVCEGL